MIKRCVVVIRTNWHDDDYVESVINEVIEHEGISEDDIISISSLLSPGFDHTYEIFVKEQDNGCI